MLFSHNKSQPTKEYRYFNSIPYSIATKFEKRALEKHSLPAPAGVEQEVTESTEPAFSDKLMMFHFSVMIFAGIGNYGIAISESQRSDLVIDYSRLNAEILKYSEDGINIMVANQWLEQPPLSVDRQDLSKK